MTLTDSCPAGYVPTRDNNYLLLPEDTILEERYAWKKATASEASPSEAGRQ